MTDTHTDDQQLREDLAHAARLAREGASAPLMGGRYGLFWGALLLVTFTAHWFIASGASGLETQYVGAVWMGYGVIAAIGSVILARSMPKTAPASNINKVESAVWGYFGLAFAAIFLGIVLRIVLGLSDFSLFDIVVPFAFAGYSTAHLTTAKISGAAQLRWGGYVAALGACGAMILYGKPEMYLFAALIILLAIIIPAWISLKHERAHA